MRIIILIISIAWNLIDKPTKSHKPTNILISLKKIIYKHNIIFLTHTHHTHTHTYMHTHTRTHAHTHTQTPHTHKYVGAQGEDCNRDERRRCDGGGG